MDVQARDEEEIIENKNTDIIFCIMSDDTITDSLSTMENYTLTYLFHKKKKSTSQFQGEKNAHESECKISSHTKRNFTYMYVHCEK